MTINITERETKAKQLFQQGYNCAQSVSLTYADITNLDPTILELISLPFGGGFGRLREICGTVSGAGIIIGAISKPNPDPHKAKTIAYTQVQNFTSKFKSENGSILCHELLSLVPNIDANPEPAARTAEYYKRRPCAEYVTSSVRIIGEMINNRELIIG